MIITIKKNADQREVDTLISSLEAKGVKAVEIKGSEFNVYGLTGDTSIIDEKSIKAYHCVENVVRVAAKYKLANRMFHPEDTVIDVNGIRIGGQENIVVIGGPCAVENHDMIVHLAQEVKDAGAKMLRGGAYKPRTSPYSFQGMRTEGILAMVDAREKSGLPIVTELMGEAQIEEFEQYVDIIQIGARNMQNFELLKEVGKRTTKPILLKRGFCNTIDEWIMSAPTATRMSSSVSAGSARSRQRPATRSISASSRSSRKRRICRSSSTLLMRPETGSWSNPLPWQPSPPARTD